MNSVNNAILTTNKMMLEDALRSLDYDKTLVCTIIDDSNAKNNRYKVQYQAIKFDAIALNGGKYKKDNQVFITIPQGNWDNQKIILGAYGGEGSKGVIYQTPLDKLVRASENLASNWETLKIPTQIEGGEPLHLVPLGNKLNEIYKEMGPSQNRLIQAIKINGANEILNNLNFQEFCEYLSSYVLQMAIGSINQLIISVIQFNDGTIITDPIIFYPWDFDLDLNGKLDSTDARLLKDYNIDIINQFLNSIIPQVSQTQLQLAGLAVTKELGQFDAIGLRFKINNAIIENAVKGVYGIRIDIKYLNENKQIQTQTSWFKSDQFIGNPYWLDGFTQELLIDYPKNATIIQDIIITPELDSVFQDIEDNEIENIPEITFSDFEIYFGYEQAKVNNKFLGIQYLGYTDQNKYYNNSTKLYSYKEEVKSFKVPVYYTIVKDNKLYTNYILNISNLPEDIRDKVQWYKFGYDLRSDEYEETDFSIAGTNYYLIGDDIEGYNKYIFNDGIKFGGNAGTKIKMLVQDTTIEDIIEFQREGSSITLEEEVKNQNNNSTASIQLKAYLNEVGTNSSTHFDIYDSETKQLNNGMTVIKLKINASDDLKLTTGNFKLKITSPRQGSNLKGFQSNIIKSTTDTEYYQYFPLYEYLTAQYLMLMSQNMSWENIRNNLMTTENKNDYKNQYPNSANEIDSWAFSMMDEEEFLTKYIYLQIVDKNNISTTDARKALQVAQDRIIYKDLYATHTNTQINYFDSNNYMICGNYNNNDEDSIIKLQDLEINLAINNSYLGLEDNHIECILYDQDLQQSFKTSIDLSFGYRNTMGTGYTLVIEPVEREEWPEEEYFIYDENKKIYVSSSKDAGGILSTPVTPNQKLGMRVNGCWGDKDRFYKLRARLYDTNHNLMVGEGIYQNIAWKLHNFIMEDNNGGMPSKAIQVVKVHQDDEKVFDNGQVKSVKATEKYSEITLAKHHWYGTGGWSVSKPDNIIVEANYIVNYDSELGQRRTVKLSQKYPLSYISTLALQYYADTGHTVKMEQDPTLSSKFICPDFISFDVQGQRIGDGEIPVGTDANLFDYYKNYFERVKSSLIYGENSELKLQWELSSSELETMALIKADVFNPTLTINSLIMNKSEFDNLSLNLYASYPLKTNNGDITKTLIYSQPICLSLPNTLGVSIVDAWDGTALTLNEDTGTVLATTLVAGTKDAGDQLFTGVMMGQINWTNEISGLSQQNSGIYGFKDNNCKFYLNNKAEFFVGNKETEQYINFNGNTLEIKSSNITLQTYDSNQILQDYLKLDDNKENSLAMKITGEIQLGLEKSKIIIKQDDFSINTPNFIVQNGAMQINSQANKTAMLLQADKPRQSEYDKISFRNLNDVYYGFYSIGNNFGIGFSETSNENGPLDYNNDQLRWYLLGTQKRTMLESISSEETYSDIKKLYIFPYIDSSISGARYQFTPIVSFYEKYTRLGWTLDSKPPSWEANGIYPQIVITKDILCYTSNIFIDRKIHVAGENGEASYINSLEVDVFKNNSDPSIKTNIISTKTSDALTLVNNLKLYDYNLKSNGAAIKLGLMSTEAPEAILGEDKKSINIYSYCGLLAKAIQELSNKLREKGVLD